MPQISIQMDGPEMDVDCDSFTEEIMKMYPDEAYIIYGDGDQFSIHVNYREWEPYQKGENLGEKFREEKFSKRKVINELKKWKKLDELYYKMLLFDGFWEGFTTRNMDIMSADSWELVKARVDFNDDYIIKKISE